MSAVRKAKGRAASVRAKSDEQSLEQMGRIMQKTARDQLYFFFYTIHTPQSYINVFSLDTVWAYIQILLKRNVLNVTDCQIRSQARSESRFYQLITTAD